MIKINERGCPKNHRCPVIRVCPTNAIVQESPFHAPKIIEEKCINCGKCSRSCGVFQVAK
ncbi:4Fe-4S binding protein [bacterium]|nr:4Fe-4S binding protein [bacterium]